MKLSDNASLGLIETKGLVGAIEAADAMAKAASVELFRKHLPGSARVVIMCQGELSACEAAITAGVRAAEDVGELLCHTVIPRPEEGAEGLCCDLIDEAMQRKKERKRQRELAAKGETPSPEAAREVSAANGESASLFAAAPAMPDSSGDAKRKPRKAGAKTQPKKGKAR